MKSKTVFRPGAYIHALLTFRCSWRITARTQGLPEAQPCAPKTFLSSPNFIANTRGLSNVLHATFLPIRMHDRPHSFFRHICAFAKSGSSQGSAPSGLHSASHARSIHGTGNCGESHESTE